MSSEASTWSSGSRSAVVEQLFPAVGLERDLASVPWASAQLHGGLEEGELVCPRREAAVSAVGVQLAQDGDERVVRRVHREVVEVA